MAEGMGQPETEATERAQDTAGLLLAADLSRMNANAPALAGARYFIAEQKEVNHKMEARASLAFAGDRTGIAGWLADPDPRRAAQCLHQPGVGGGGDQPGDPGGG